MNNNLSQSQVDSDIKLEELIADQPKTPRRLKNFGCGDCSLKFDSNSQLVRHRRTHTGEKPLKCEQCEFKTAYSQSLQRHIDRRHRSVKCNESIGHVHNSGVDSNKSDHPKLRSKNFECDDCSLKFDSNYQLMQHRRTHTGEKPLKCEQCEFETAYSQSLQRHTDRRHRSVKSNESIGHLADHPKLRSKNFECDDCSLKFDSNLKLMVHRRTHTGEKPLECEQCDFKTGRQKKLKIHIANCHKPLRCVSKYEFTLQERKHIVSDLHKKLRPHECEICGNAFSLKWNLVVHRRTHNDEKPFQCELCAAAFTTGSKLRCHQRIHSDKKPFECDQCEFKSAYPSSLKWHVLHVHRCEHVDCDALATYISNNNKLAERRRMHVGEKQFACDHCFYRTATKASLRKHTTLVHGSKLRRYKCDVCGKAFAINFSLTIHRRTHTHEKRFNQSEFGTAVANSLKQHVQSGHVISETVHHLTTVPDSKVFTAARLEMSRNNNHINEQCDYETISAISVKTEQNEGETSLEEIEESRPNHQGGGRKNVCDSTVLLKHEDVTEETDAQMMNLIDVKMEIKQEFSDLLIDSGTQ